MTKKPRAHRIIMSSAKNAFAEMEALVCLDCFFRFCVFIDTLKGAHPLYGGNLKRLQNRL
jgi:hypothetical protein